MIETTNTYSCKYQDQISEISKMCGVQSVEVKHIVVSPLGAVTNKVDKWLEKRDY